MPPRSPLNDLALKFFGLTVGEITRAYMKDNPLLDKSLCRNMAVSLVKEFAGYERIVSRDCSRIDIMLFSDIDNLPNQQFDNTARLIPSGIFLSKNPHIGSFHKKHLVT